MDAEYIVIDDPGERKAVEHGVAGLPDPFPKFIAEPTLGHSRGTTTVAI